MGRAQDAVGRAVREIESEAERIRAEIEKQRKDLEKRVRPLQDQLSDLEAAIRRLTRRAGGKSGGRKPSSRGRAPRGANKQAILTALKKEPGSSAAQIAEMTGIKATVVSSSLTNLAKKGEVKRTKRKGRVSWRAAA